MARITEKRSLHFLKVSAVNAQTISGRLPPLFQGVPSGTSPHPVNSNKAYVYRVLLERNT